MSLEAIIKVTKAGRVAIPKELRESSDGGWKQVKGDHRRQAGHFRGSSMSLKTTKIRIENRKVKRKWKRFTDQALEQAFNLVKNGDFLKDVAEEVGVPVTYLSTKLTKKYGVRYTQFTRRNMKRGFIKYAIGI